MTLPTASRLPGLLLGLLLAVTSGCGADRSEDAAVDGSANPAADGTGSAAASPGVLARAAAHLETDRPLGAARLLRPYMSESGLDSEGRLLAARAEAGAGEWGRVRSLLVGAGGLDSLDGGQGLYLLARALDEAGDLDAARASYDAFLAAADSSEVGPERGAARLRRALVLLRLDPEAGDSAFAEIVDVPPDWRALLAAEALARDGHAGRVEALAGPYSGGDLGRRAWAARVEAARRAGDLGAARDLADQARAAARSDEDRAAAALTAGTLAAEAGDDDAARALFRAAIGAAPGSAAAQEAAAFLRRGTPGPDDWLALARTDRALGLNAEAADALRQWLGAGAGTPAERTDVRVEAADALFDAQRYDEAGALLAPVMDRADARSLWAGALGRSGRTDEAAALYLDLAAADPARYTYFAADVLHQGGDLAAALPLYERVEREHPGTRWAGLATMRRAGQAFLDGDYATAARLWDGYRARHSGGTHALQARYWAGRALAEAGDATAAAERFRGVLREDRLSYYALLAAEALGEPFWPPPLSPSPPEDPATAARVAEALRGADVLREAGFPDAAEAALDRAAARVGSGQAEQYALVEALVERGHGRRAILIAQGLSGGTNLRRLRALYPFPYRRMIEAEARAHGVDPFLVAALIRQESQFSARATSPVGARGLMQLMPTTARALAREEGEAEARDPERLYLPEVNVRLGIRYVAEQVRAYGGSLPAVFGAYNAGPHQVDAWRAFPEFGQDALFTERVPFRETRDYIKILTLNRAIYEGLYGTE